MVAHTKNRAMSGLYCPWAKGVRDLQSTVPDPFTVQQATNLDLGVGLALAMAFTD